MQRKIWAAFAPGGKASNHSTTLTGVLFPCVQRFPVFMLPTVRPRPALLRQMDMGYLTCAHIWVRALLN